MALLLEHNIQTRDLINIDNCRRFLKILTLGDMMTGDGQFILPSIKQVQDLQPSPPRWHGPIKPTPDQKHGRPGGDT